MGFISDLVKRAQEARAAQKSSANQEVSQKPQAQSYRQPQPVGMQRQGSDIPETDPGVKEIRTYRRDGTSMIEEYERLAPDGTVIKTVSVGDQRDGLKKFDVYKMDKSGIVRRLDGAGQGDDVSIESVRDFWLDKLKKMSEKSNVQDEYDDREEDAYNDESRRGIKDFQQIKQYVDRMDPGERSAIFNNFKGQLLTYATNKLKKILIPKLDDRGDELGLTDEQKGQLLDYGIEKLHNRLDDSIDEERFFRDVWPKYESFKDFEDDMNKSSSAPVSFVFNPNSNMTHSDASKMKPVSFVIRPEYSTKSSSNLGAQFKQENIKKNNTFESDALKKQNLRDTYRSYEPKFSENVEDEEPLGYLLEKLQRYMKRHINENNANNDERRKFKKSCLDIAIEGIRSSLIRNSQEEEYDRKRTKYFKEEMMENDEIFGNEESVDNTFEKLQRYIKRHITEDNSLTTEKKQSKQEFIDLALESIRKQLKTRPNKEEEYNNTKSEKTRIKDENLNDADLTDFEDVFDFGKSLRKLLKKSLTKRKDDWGKNAKEDADSSTQRIRNRSHRDTVTNYQQKKIRFEDIFNIPKEKRQIRERESSEVRKPIYTWERASKPSVETLQPKEEKPSIFDTFLSQLKPQSPGKREPESSSGHLKDTNRYSNKHQSESPNESESTKTTESQIFDLSKILDKINKLFISDSNDDTSTVENEESNDNNYSYSTRPIETTKSPSSIKENNSNKLDFNTIISKLKENLTNNSQRKPDSAPKQIRYSNPYSFQKPPHATTKVSTRRLGTHQNDQNNISFRIQPQDYSTSTDRSVENEHISTKPRTEDNDFMPWWFGNGTNSSHRDSVHPKEHLTPKQPATSILGDSMFGDSFFTNFLGNDIQNPQIPKF